ncbi:MAG TPA: 2-aminoethylphosphonate ABC transporter substrate-binding protein [Casimicrobiaceae bacterium]|nr:2-aminoethylphosphonate ABC transporter substrate-binding protein [Casimicrobiaceae bacterium]
MRRYSVLLLLALAVGMVAAAPAQAQSVVTIYAADGLKDGKPNWFDTQFDAFTKETGIKVQYIESGSGEVINRVEREKTNTQADVIVTLPPFIQKAAADGMLEAYTPADAAAIPASSRDPKGEWYPLVNNYSCFIYNGSALQGPPKTWNDLLDPKFKGKIQYSTPGQAGDGTALMVLAFHAMGSKDAAFDFLKKLQANNVGPSSSTGKLAAKVNKGELLVANGDMQMNFSQMTDNPNLRIFWPADAKGQRTALPLPYYMGLVKGAPHSANGKKLIDFLLSKKAQETVSSIARGIPVRSDVKPTDENFTKLHGFMEGVTIWTPNWDEVLRDLSKDVARWHEVTGS